MRCQICIPILHAISVVRTVSVARRCEAARRRPSSTRDDHIEPLARGGRERGAEKARSGGNRTRPAADFLAAYNHRLITTPSTTQLPSHLGHSSRLSSPCQAEAALLPPSPGEWAVAPRPNTSATLHHPSPAQSYRPSPLLYLAGPMRHPLPPRALQSCQCPAAAEASAAARTLHPQRTTRAIRRTRNCSNSKPIIITRTRPSTSVHCVQMARAAMTSASSAPKCARGTSWLGQGEV